MRIKQQKKRMEGSNRFRAHSHPRLLASGGQVSPLPSHLVSERMAGISKMLTPDFKMVYANKPPFVPVPAGTPRYPAVPFGTFWYVCLRFGTFWYAMGRRTLKCRKL